MNTNKTLKLAYIYWFTIFLGMGGIHRLYLGKTTTGILWLFSFGLLGIGQSIDLILIPKMLERRNTKREDELLMYEVI
jgi:TM2 domain-containing membrane protein YozV